MLKDYILLLLVSALLLGLVGLATFRSSAPEYARHQERYFELTGTKDGEVTISQVNVPVNDGMIVDRCASCHAGASNPDATDFPAPLRTHPEIAPGISPDAHDFGKIGCVICHDGNGRALDGEDAHGEHHAWVAPILKGEAVQANCIRCHDTNAGDLPGAERVSMGRRLFMRKACWACHTIDGVSDGKIGPVLTDAGGKFGLAYLRESIVNPAANIASSRMPLFSWAGETDTVEALTIYLKSGQKRRIRNYDRAPVGTVRPAAAFAHVAAAGAEAGRAIFMAEGAGAGVPPGGCVNCHSVRENDGNLVGGNVGPELTYAGRARTREYLEKQITRPKDHNPDTVMPPFSGYNTGDVSSLVSYLQSLTYVDGQAQTGEQIYKRYCASCHGDDRSGRGPNYRLLDPYPRNLSRKQFVLAYRDRFTNSISRGIEGTAMPPWKDILTSEQIGAVIDYLVEAGTEDGGEKPSYVRLDVALPKPGDADRLTGRPIEAADPARGARQFEMHCTGCHGKLANGKGPNAYFMDNVYPRNLLNARHMRRTDVTDERLYRSIALGVPGTPMPSHSHLGDQAILDLISHVRQLTSDRQETP